MWWLKVCVVPWFWECGSRVSASELRAQRSVSALAAPTSMEDARRAAARPVSLVRMIDQSPLMIRHRRPAGHRWRSAIIQSVPMPLRQARNTDTGVQYVGTARSGGQALSVDRCAGIVFLHDDPSLRLGASNAGALRAEAATKRLLCDRAMGKWTAFTSTSLPFIDQMVKNSRESGRLRRTCRYELQKIIAKNFLCAFEVHVRPASGGVQRANPGRRSCTARL